MSDRDRKPESGTPDAIAPSGIALPDARLAAAIIAQSPDAIIFSGNDGIIRLWNARCEEIFGFTAAEAIGQSLDIIIPERLRAAHWRGFDQAIANGKTRLSGKPALTRAVDKAGGKLYVELAFGVVVDDKGVVVGALATARKADPGKLRPPGSGKPGSE